MSEPTNNPQDQKQGADLANELRELGQQIEQAVRAAFQNERAQTMQRDISAGMREIGTQVQHALQAIKEDPRIQHLAERGQQAVVQAQESQAAKDLQETLARGIAQLNDQLASFINRTRSSSATEMPGAQNVPIDHDAATGETTRLDPDQK